MSTDSTAIPTVLLEQIGISAAVSGGISALVNYILTMRQSRKEREAAAIQEKLNLYAILIYQVKKLRNFGAKPFQEQRKEDLRNDLKTIFSLLESSIKDKYHLLKHDEILRIDTIRDFYRMPYQNWEKVDGELKELYRLLCEEYNNTIPKYESVVSKGMVQKISYDEK